MAFRHCELGLLIRLDPKRARTKLLKSFKRFDGKLDPTAQSFGVHRATLKRWMHALELHEDVAAIREQAA